MFNKYTYDCLISIHVDNYTSFDYRWVSLNTFTWTTLGGQLHTCCCFV